MKPQELWNTLHAAGFTRQAEMPAVAPRAPWYMEAMLFIALWTGAAFVVIAFVAFAEDSPAAYLFFGLPLSALACWLFRAYPAHFFLGQLAHAVSLCGAGLILFALFEEVRGYEAQLYLSLALALLVFCAMNNFVQRLVAVSAALFVVTALCHYYWKDARFLWLEWLYAGCVFAFVLVWQREMQTLRYPRSQIWRSVGYALALFLLVAMNFSLMLASNSGWIDSRGITEATRESALVMLALRVLSGLTLFWFAAWLLRREKLSFSRRPALILLGLALGVALLGMKMPGIAVALLILVTGFAANAPVLLGIGVVMLLNVFAQYYYWLEVSLLYKSLYLLLTGGVLLACRLALRWRETGDRKQETDTREENGDE
ncbi:MAG: DUF4401 domain-containing protein [Burkholderiales bacterium]|jgi:hypothetical protein|nr:DUF4401 domain-containing protein [Burkholderiales bacterium]